MQRTADRPNTITSRGSAPALRVALALLVGAALGAAVGWSSTTPVYRAEGSIVLPSFAFAIEKGGGCVLYEEFPSSRGHPWHAARAAIIRSPRVLTAAVARLEESSASLSWHELSEQLQIRHVREEWEEFEFAIAFVHSDPDVAASVVTACIDAYGDMVSANATRGAAPEGPPDDRLWALAVRRPVRPTAPVEDGRPTAAAVASLIGAAVAFGVRIALRTASRSRTGFK